MCCNADFVAFAPALIERPRERVDVWVIEVELLPEIQLAVSCPGSGNGIDGVAAREVAAVCPVTLRIRCALASSSEINEKFGEP